MISYLNNDSLNPIEPATGMDTGEVKKAYGNKIRSGRESGRYPIKIK